MKIVSAKCPDCGTQLHINGNEKWLKCEFCGASLFVDYDPEDLKGRPAIQAEETQQESEPIRVKVEFVEDEPAENAEPEKQKHSFWWWLVVITLGISFWPFVLIYWLVKTDKVSPEAKKIIWIVLGAFFGVCLIIGMIEGIIDIVRNGGTVPTTTTTTSASRYSYSTRTYSTRTYSMATRGAAAQTGFCGFEVEFPILR